MKSIMHILWKIINNINGDIMHDSNYECYYLLGKYYYIDVLKHRKGTKI